MPIIRPQLINEEIYHIVVRGVEKRSIFGDETDYYRAIFSLYEFNDDKQVLIRERRRDRLRAKKNGREQFSANREKLVEILTFCLMPNHVHLLLRQVKDYGISKFMRKFGAGYATYFNKKYDRVGHLFQGRFRAVHVRTNEQLKNVFVYIHTNPAIIIEHEWEEGKIENPKKVINFLENYKWSSYLDYIGKKNFPSVTNREVLNSLIGDKENCRKFVNAWIEYKKEISPLGDIILE